MAGSKTAATRRITDDKKVADQDKERARAEARSARRLYERQARSNRVIPR